MKFRVLIIAGFTIAAGLAAPINIVPYAGVGSSVVTFEDVIGTPFPGTTYGTLISGGLTFGERFSGQTLTFDGDLDVLDGTATGPLAVIAGEPGKSLSIGTDTGDNELYPYGPVGFPAPNGYGEGAWAALFPSDVSTLGFISAFGASEVFVSFFRADGSLILTVSAAGGAAVGFARQGAVRDIRGFSVYTNDPGGLSYDDIRSDLGAQVIPEPMTTLLFAVGLAAVAAMRMRKQETIGPQLLKK